MMHWYSTLLIAGVVLLGDVATALVIRRAGGFVTGEYIAMPTAALLFLLLYGRYPLYVLSGLLASRAGTWVDGVLAGLVVAGFDGSLGWALSAAIRRHQLPRCRAPGSSQPCFPWPSWAQSPLALCVAPLGP
jgi:hypothetical protein